ncbi:MAG TPA: glutathione synthase, partial [Chromatiales bacterium]|nr:glutathione synthase [Chromatiales bacterium]
MPMRLGVIMDPIGSINYKKDSTLAMLLAAARRGWQLQYLEPPDLFLAQGEARGLMRPLQVRADPDDWFTLGAVADRPLADLDVILMRRDPP